MTVLTKDYPDATYTMALTGSGAMSAANFLKIPFIQEVISCKRAVEKYLPETDIVIELGGEDAKIIYFDKFIEQRMNGTCAGGTGAFLDQMASLLNTDTAGLNELAKSYKVIYPIASRCGVFAKTDVQPLLNEGSRKEDIAASIFQAVVNQTISGLACGRPIRGKVAFLGGPLSYLPELRKRFIETLELKDNEIGSLKKELSTKDRIIYKLQAEKEKLKQELQKFKGFWHSIMSHFHKRICYDKDNNYKIVSDDLYKNGIFDDNDNEIANNIARRVTIPDENKQIKNKKKNNDTRF